jgi:hypothetical protein
MMTKDLADQLRAEVARLKAVQEQFLRTYRQLCLHYGGPQWHGKDLETVFHQVRGEIIPIMEEADMDHKSVQALCSWAEWRVLNG